jgi:3-methyladenine DNA glycosylase Mpg
MEQKDKQETKMAMITRLKISVQDLEGVDLRLSKSKHSEKYQGIRISIHKAIDSTQRLIKKFDNGLI